MILKRIGNKAAIAKSIIPYFPQHSIYLEPCFGAGGMFFNKPKVERNFVNDIDLDVFNLFMVFLNKRDELEYLWNNLLIHTELLEYWKNNEEDDPVKKAVRFLYISNLTWMGTGASLDMGGKSKLQTSKHFDRTFELLNDVKFTNWSFEKFLKSVQYIKTHPKECFIYADPPYLGTFDTYSNSFTEADSEKLFDCLEKTNCNWAMSEFDHPFILAQVEKRKLEITVIGERTNLNNKRTELLITNYKTNQLSLF